MFPPDGDYAARRNKPVVIVESKDGALGIEIPYEFVGPEQYQGVSTFYFGAKDGTVMNFTWDALKEIFPGWGAEDPFELEEIPLNDDGAAEFILAKCLVDTSWTPPGKTEPVPQFKASFLNSLLRGKKISEPIAADKRKSILTKWKSRFKAVNSTKPESKPAGKTAAPTVAPKKAAASGPPGRKSTAEVARTSTQEEVWGALCKARGEDADQDAVAKEYYDALDAVVEGRTDLTPSEWGKVADHLEV